MPNGHAMLMDTRRNFDDILIQEVKQHNLLWDSSMWEYKDIEKRREAWQEISETLASSVDVCKRRWEQLRGCFTKVKAKQMRDGASPTWKFYEPLLFLSDFIVPKSYVLPPSEQMVYSHPSMAHNLMQTATSSQQSGKQLQDGSSTIPGAPSATMDTLQQRAVFKCPPDESIESIIELDDVDEEELSTTDQTEAGLQPNFPQNHIFPPAKQRRLNFHVHSGNFSNPFTTSPSATASADQMPQQQQSWPLLFSAMSTANNQSHRNSSTYTVPTTNEEENEDTLFGRSIGKSLQRYPQNMKMGLKIAILEVFRKADDALDPSNSSVSQSNPKASVATLSQQLNSLRANTNSSSSSSLAELAALLLSSAASSSTNATNSGTSVVNTPVVTENGSTHKKL